MSRDHLRLDYLPLFIDQNLDADRASQMNLLRHGRIDWLRQADSFRSQHARRHAFGLGLWWNRFGGFSSTFTRGGSVLQVTQTLEVFGSAGGSALRVLKTAPGRYGGISDPLMAIPSGTLRGSLVVETNCVRSDRVMFGSTGAFDGVRRIVGARISRTGFGVSRATAGTQFMSSRSFDCISNCAS